MLLKPWFVVVLIVTLATKSELSLAKEEALNVRDDTNAFIKSSLIRGHASLPTKEDLFAQDPAVGETNFSSVDLHRISEADFNRRLQDAEDAEPFTLGSLQPKALKEAVLAANEKVFDWASKGIVEAIGDEIPEWVHDISMDAVKEIQEKLVSFIQNLDDGKLEDFETMIASVSSLDLETALDTVLNPGGQSCSASGSSPSISSFDTVLPDISSGKDAISNLANAAADCLADIDFSQLGFNIRGLQKRRLEDDTSSCPADDPPKTGVSVSLGVSVDASFGFLKPKTAPTFSSQEAKKPQFKISGSSGCAVEAGFDPDFPAGAVALACSPPLTALGVSLRYASVDCDEGYFCELGQRPGIKCPKGFFCSGKTKRACAAGYYCPAGSTSEFGEPIDSYPSCSKGEKCKCKAGYFCPLASTTERGNPLVDQNTPEATLDHYSIPGFPKCNVGVSCCGVLKDCICPIGYYCKAGVGPVGIGRCRGSCRTRGCTNNQCIEDSGKPKDNKIARLMKRVVNSEKLEYGGALSLNYYWDVSAAPWNGANGFAVSVSLPFPFLPSVSLILNAPPWHCLEKPVYALAGIGFDVVEVDLKSIRDTFQELKDIGITDEIKNKLNDVSTYFEPEISFGVSYDYTVLAAPKNFDYLWCGACESCNDCEACNEGPFFEDPEDPEKDDKCLAEKVEGCNTRRSCTKRLLRGGGGRDLQLSTSIEDFTSFITGFASTFSGELETPFCFGPDCTSPRSQRNTDRVIQGRLRAGSTKNCDGLELSARIDDHLKVEQILSVLFNEVPSSDFLDPLLAIGLEGPLELALTMSSVTSLTLSARRPTKKATPSAFDDSGDILTTVLNFINLLQLEVYGKVERTTSGVAFASGVCVSLGKGDGQSCLEPPSQVIVPSNFNGITIADGVLLFEYFAFQVGFEQPPAPGVPSSFMEISVGLNICPKTACKKGVPQLFLEGTVKGELSVSPTIGGGLQQVGTWWESFDCALDCRLHISDFLAKAQFGAKFPVPDSLELGGQICVGTKDNCEAGVLDNTIRAGAFLGFDSNDPSNNYVVAFISKLTLGNSLRALGMDDYSDALPPALRESGILRSKNADDFTCAKNYAIPKSVDEAAVAMPKLDLQCFAYIAITSREVEIPGIAGTINEGFSISGRLLIDYGVELDLNVDAFFNPTTKDFKIDAELYLSLPKDDPVATITGSDGKSPAKLFVEKTTGASLGLAMKIDGKISIPDINTEGIVKIIVNSKRLVAEGSLDLFGALKTSGEIRMATDMSYLRVAVNEFTIANAFGFRDILFEYKELETGGVSVELSGQFSAGNWDIFSGKILIVVDKYAVSFTAEARLKCVVALDASGVLNIDDISSSQMTRLDVRVDGECLAEAAKFVAEEIVKGLENAASGLHDLEDDLTAACESAKESIGEGAAALACAGGDVAGALADAFEFGAKLITGERYSGLITEFKDEGDHDEVDCVLDIPLNMYPLEKYGTKWDELFPEGDCPSGWDSCCDTHGSLPDYADDVDWSDIKGKINGYYDSEYGCEKKYDYRSKTNTDYLVTYPNFECINKIRAYRNANQAKVTTVEEKQVVVDTVKKDNACALGGQIKSKVETGDAFTISTFEITKKPTATDVGQIKLFYQVEEFTNDNNGCTVSAPIDKTCFIEVPKGKSVNQFLKSQITFKFADCIQNDIMINQKGVPSIKPELELATARLELVSHRRLSSLDLAVVRVYCDGVDALESGTTFRPELVGVDPACDTRSPTFSFEDTEIVLVENDPNFTCGTKTFVRTWAAWDGCGRQAESTVSQTIYIEPSKPKFDVSVLQGIQLKTSSNPVPSYKAFPKATSYCGGFVEVDFEDVNIQTITTGQCNHWTMERKWTAWEEIEGCTVEEAKELYLSDPLMQIVEVTDDSEPEFVDTDNIDDKRIPFFDNFQSSESIPSARDGRAHVGYGSFSPHLVNSLTLSSDDTPAVLTTIPGASESTCATDGLASFSRTWTIEDACGNQKKEVQKVVIEHPPKLLTETVEVRSGAFSFLRAVGVNQITTACMPGKELLLGKASYSEEGSRHWAAAASPVVELLAMKPTFTFKPTDIRITTAESPLPAMIGQAEGISFCGTPFEIVHEDSPPISSTDECGVWTFTRTWTIRPTYRSCDGVVEDSRLVDSFEQVITVEDVFPPQFISTPAENIKVGFLANYGPDATGLPLVQKITTDPDIAMLLDGTGGKPLASYPITLSYDDAVSFPDPSTMELCDVGAMAIIERTWTTTDACDISDTWIQTIQIDRPKQDLLDDASAFQVFTPGTVHIEHTDIAENLATEQNEGIYMKHVLLASRNREESWTGLDPDKSKSEPSKKEKQYHNSRGVTENPSICRDNDYVLVLGDCPKRGTFKDVFLEGNDITSVVGGSKKSSKDDMCERIHGPGGSQDGFDPVNFDTASDAIEAFSDQLANDIPALMTGPKLITCSSTDQASCSALNMADSEQDGEVVFKEGPNGGVGETIELVGNGMVYNFFNINLHEWFFRIGKEYEQQDSSSESASKRGRDLGKKSKSRPIWNPIWDPVVMVKSPGMVFVNVKYKTKLRANEIEPSKSKKKSEKESGIQTSVRHDFQRYIDGEDLNAESEFYFDFPQGFGDSYGKNSATSSKKTQAERYLPSKNSNDEKMGYAWWDNDLSMQMTNLWVPRRVVFEEGTLGQEYFLVNMPNPEISNPDDVLNPKEAAALSLSFMNTKHIKGSALWTGTLVIGNKHTSISLEETTWVGGQLILAGGKLDLTKSTVLCGRYAANAYCPHPPVF